MLGTEVSVLHGLFHLALESRGRSSYLHFTDKETETWRDEVTCPKSPTPGSHQPEPNSQPHVVPPQLLFSNQSDGVNSSSSTELQGFGDGHKTPWVVWRAVGLHMGHAPSLSPEWKALFHEPDKYFSGICVVEAMQPVPCSTCDQTGRRPGPVASVRSVSFKKEKRPFAWTVDSRHWHKTDLQAFLERGQSMSQPRVPFPKQGHSQPNSYRWAPPSNPDAVPRVPSRLGSWKGCMEPRKENKEHKLCPEGRGIELRASWPGLMPLEHFF